MNLNNSIEDLVSAQRRFFKSGTTRDIHYRVTQLKKLRSALIAKEAEVIQALRTDLNKSEQESFTTEIGIVYKELSYVIRNIHQWAKPRKVKTALTHIGSRGRILPEPYGTVLIIAPWNYPWQLAISPLIGAMAAGNTAVIKPSELTPAVSAVISALIKDTFPESYAAVVEGGPDTSTCLLQQPVDYIFFTGSTRIGKIVMQAASQHLTPVTLELGGKSPCIVHRDASLKLTAKRIVFGKFTNAGQTCVAPDYLLVHESVKEPLLQYMKEAITEFYGESPLKNPDYGRIVSEKHFLRLSHFLDNGSVRHGGNYDESNLLIEPTLLDDITWDMPVMEDEIFGPIFPILTYNDLNEVIATVNARPKPLALYLFTNDAGVQKQIMSEISFGGGCINDTLMHLATPYLPFGGVGASGMGAYHGKHSFDTFSHMKSILHQTNKFDFSFRYPGKDGLKLLRKLMKP
ncbi:aldehyde dehydrogenase [Paenibacillus dakarensis]|uniref:aldehyde dehydrogenase n=1 Tax=Paenibacillus dakarensis TaxID=1527293 RepID=UPI0006D57CF3|nr:aldehyde dehydrogenase [Paenibacillus dakarensis]